MVYLKQLAIGFSLLTLPFFSATAETKAQEKMKSHLDVIKNILDAAYAPCFWKESQFGWNLDIEISLAKRKVDENSKINVAQFQKIVRDFFSGMRDQHSFARFHATEEAELPFLVKGANNRYFISHINKGCLASSVYQISIGDELVIFDDKKTHDAVLDLQKEISQEFQEGANRALAEMFLTNRKRCYGHEVPKDPVKIGIKKRDSEKVRFYQLAWNYKPECITSGYKIFQGKDFSLKKECPFKENRKETFFKQLMISSHYEFFENLRALSPECGHNPGARKSFLGDLGKTWWVSSKKKTFHAYLYENDAGNLIGYIRIPHYSGSLGEVLEFAEIINLFEERSDCLVIDQMNNPGGSLFYMCALTALLTEQPLEVPKHQIALNQSEIAEAIKAIPIFEEVSNDEEAIQLLGESFYGNPVTFQTIQFVLNYFRFLVDEWNQGKTLTSPTYLYGFDQINPSPFGFYSKPILVLVNELSISAAEFFPAILQDNKRATIMGAKTSGAGGFVLKANFPNLFGLKDFRYTGSIALRKKGDPIENLGVSPDVLYKISEEDLQCGYCVYSQEINAQVQELIEKDHR